jgi:hypothetical protein
MIEQTVRLIYSLLLNKAYADLASLTGGVRLSARDIEECITEYGCELVAYPENIQLDVVGISGSSPKEWSVVAPIYTAEEGISDLSIELSLTESGEAILKSELDNIRVR